MKNTCKYKILDQGVEDESMIVISTFLTLRKLRMVDKKINKSKTMFNKKNSIRKFI